MHVVVRALGIDKLLEDSASRGVVAILAHRLVGVLALQVEEAVLVAIFVDGACACPGVVTDQEIPARAVRFWYADHVACPVVVHVRPG